jgi:hypothetical protein
MKRNLYHDTLAHCPPKDLCPASYLGIMTIMNAFLAQEVHAVEELFPFPRSYAHVHTNWSTRYCASSNSVSLTGLHTRMRHEATPLKTSYVEG